jgi:small subunit ribosomal protein S4
MSEYAMQLAEKQKVKLVYGLRERQLRRYFREALKEKQATPQALAIALERRLDSVVFRMGLAPSRSVARSLVSHGHFMVNGRRVTIPSYALRQGDVVMLRPESQKKAFVERIRQNLKRATVPPWLTVDPQNLSGTVKRLPTADELKLPFDLSRIVEFYSK